MPLSLYLITKTPTFISGKRRIGFPPSFILEQIATALGLGIVLTLGFHLLNWQSADFFASGAAVQDVSLAVDAHLPFWPGWIWIYLAYFPVCFLPLFFQEVRQERELFMRTAVGFAAQFFLAFLVFYFFPVRMVRPEFIPSSLSESAVAWLYRVDPGFNIFPSLHVANSAFLACLAWRLRGALPGSAVWLLCLLISMSTLLVKQHYLVDVPAGFLLGIGCFMLAYKVNQARPKAASAVVRPVLPMSKRGRPAVAHSLVSRN